MALALLIAGSLAGPLAPARATEEPEFDLPAVMAEFWASEAGMDLVAEYTVDPSTSGTTDPVGDFEHSSGEPPGLSPDDTLDLTSLRDFDFAPPPGLFQPVSAGGIFCEPDPFDPPIPGVRTVCPEDGIDPSAFADGARVTVFETAGEFGLFNANLSCEWVVWHRLPGAPVFEPMPQYPLDPAAGTNGARGFRTGGDQFGPFGLDYNSEGFFEPVPTNTVVAMGENQIAFFTPMSEVGAADAVRGYSFCTEGSFQASDSVADSTQLVERMPVTLELVTVAPVVETTTTTSTTTTTTEATTTSLVSVVEEANTEGGSFSMNVWLPLLIGGTVVLVGVTFYWRTRERKRGGTTPAGPGGTPSDPGAGHGSPIASTVVGDDHGRCDWALYVNDGGARKLLRPAKGHECCVYDVDISTAVFLHDEALRGRQDAVSPQGAIASPDERLRIPDVGHGLGGGTSLWGWTSARSGPAGRLDWMQGGGDPREKVGRKIDHSDAAQVSQQRTLEEGPEVASHLTHLEYTSVKATLEAGCPDHTNTYSLNGTSEVFVQATQECTNGAPGPECPVELTAAGWVEAALMGDLRYSTSEYAHGDVDEIEGRLQAMREKNRPLAMTDSHDHATRPADTYDSARTGSGANSVDKDDMGFTLLSGVGLDAGTIVPVATWPNTERVTADIYADLDHDVTVDARMARGDCEATACGGHGECLCEPEFKLNVGPNQAKLTVDGQTYNMARPSPEGVWHLT